MLQKLNIQNYAIIDELEISFSANLNIITGETGAGKSIVMGALGLVLGDRADSSVMMNKNKKSVVEGWFNAKGLKEKKGIKELFEENELEWEDELLIRREITPNGKSRAFVNDTPVNLSQLKQLATFLVDLHQQFDTLELGDNDFQRQVLDALAGNTELLNNYGLLYQHYTQVKQELQALQQQQANANKELDYNKFLFDELEEAGLKENELEELDIELKLLSNAETVKQQLTSIYFELKESEQPIVQQIKSLINKVHALEQYHSAIPELAKRLQGSQAELQDIADELEHINDSVQYSPERIQEVNDKISLGYKLQKKHAVHSTGELLAIKETLQQKLNNIFNIGETIAQKEKATAELLQQCVQLAQKISANRKKSANPFSGKVNGLLAQVGMPNAVIKVSLEDLKAPGQYGSDAIEFLFDANKSNRFEPLYKVASGGELSRLMLCIKSLVAQQLQLPTLIFDEIDTGISGEAARQVGNIMKELAARHQVISITHQPQIAARANAHYFVYKEIKGDKIATSIRLLNNDERISAIAKMLSGEKPTAAAIENAKEMVGN
jgi:DNA repair protein RecN (Recombination protein N)